MKCPNCGCDIFSLSTVDQKADMIKQVCADYFSIPVSRLNDREKSQVKTKPRHIAIYLIDKHLKLNLNNIGLFFGNRKHTAVKWGLDRVKKAVEDKDDVYYDVIELDKRVKSILKDQTHSHGK